MLRSDKRESSTSGSAFRPPVAPSASAIKAVLMRKMTACVAVKLRAPDPKTEDARSRGKLDVMGKNQQVLVSFSHSHGCREMNGIERTDDAREWPVRA